MKISAMVSSTDDRRAYRNVAVLVAAQAVLGAQMPMIFTFGGLAGQSLAPNPCFATLPISLIVLGSMLAATPISTIMQRYGRQAGFLVGTISGILGGAVGAWGLLTHSFTVFLVGSLFTGVYMSSHGFYRFAAADTASDEFRPKAISYVMAGGLAAAIIGPQIAKLSADAVAIPFMGIYLAVMALNIFGLVFLPLLDIPRPPAPGVGQPKGRSYLQLLKTPRIAVAIICAMVSYALMNLVMTSTPLAVVGCGFTRGNAADVVSAHVLAMFAPSFFTGHLIARFGAERVVAAGLSIRRRGGRGTCGRRSERSGRRGGRGTCGRRSDEFLHRVDIPGTWLELRLYRRDGDAGGVAPARGARSGAGHERHDCLRLRYGRFARERWPYELFRRVSPGRMDRS